jgi:hypothetical protein
VFINTLFADVELFIVLYGCETSLLTLREECRLTVFEKRVLRVFGPKRDEATREWRKLHSGLYSLPNIVRVVKSSRTRWAGHVALMGGERSAQGVGGET